MTPSAAIDQDKAKALEIFRERCEARSWLVRGGHMTLIEAVDELWFAAERAGLVKGLGADEVQRLMAAAFARWCCDG